MRLLDATLREGSQMPGRDYSVDQKVSAARALDDFGLPYVQVGFPATGERDREAVRRLAGDLRADVVAIARAVESDVEAALAADADVVEVFAPLSSLHLEHAIGKSREEAFAMLGEAVDRIHEGGATAHVTFVDAFRTDREHLVRAFETFDAEYVTLADTVGARTPRSVESILSDLAPDVDLGRVGVHFHDDLGVATANVLTAYEVGVAKADVSVASLGERAGNPALEEVVVAGDLEYDESFGLDREALVPACHAVLDALDEAVDPRKAVLGEEVTQHESGIHTAAMLEEPSVFEPYSPERFGGERTLLFGRGTGRTGARRLLERAGVEADAETVDAFLDLLGDEGPMDAETAEQRAREAFGD